MKNFNNKNIIIKPVTFHISERYIIENAIPFRISSFSSSFKEVETNGIFVRQSNNNKFDTRKMRNFFIGSDGGGGPQAHPAYVIPGSATMDAVYVSSTSLNQRSLELRGMGINSSLGLQMVQLSQKSNDANKAQNVSTNLRLIPKADITYTKLPTDIEESMLEMRGQLAKVITQNPARMYHFGYKSEHFQPCFQGDRGLSDKYNYANTLLMEQEAKNFKDNKMSASAQHYSDLVSELRAAEKHGNAELTDVLYKRILNNQPYGDSSEE